MSGQRYALVNLERGCCEIFTSRQVARQVLFDYSEVFYNRQRPHSGVDYARPINRAA